MIVRRQNSCTACTKLIGTTLPSLHSTAPHSTGGWMDGRRRKAVLANQPGSRVDSLSFVCEVVVAYSTVVSALFCDCVVAFVAFLHGVLFSPRGVCSAVFCRATWQQEAWTGTRCAAWHTLDPVMKGTRRTDQEEHEDEAPLPAPAFVPGASSQPSTGNRQEEAEEEEQQTAGEGSSEASAVSVARLEEPGHEGQGEACTLSPSWSVLVGGHPHAVELRQMPFAACLPSVFREGCSASVGDDDFDSLQEHFWSDGYLLLRGLLDRVRSALVQFVRRAVGCVYMHSTVYPATKLFVHFGTPRHGTLTRQHAAYTHATGSRVEGRRRGGIIRSSAPRCAIIYRSSTRHPPSSCSRDRRERAAVAVSAAPVRCQPGCRVHAAHEVGARSAPRGRHGTARGLLFLSYDGSLVTQRWWCQCWKGD